LIDALYYGLSTPSVQCFRTGHGEDCERQSAAAATDRAGRSGARGTEVE
jgi:hypothetical protein